MNKALNFFLVILLLGTYILHSDDLIDVYKKGEIKLIPNPEFGRSTDWGDPFYYRPSSLVILHDGSMFAAISNQHRVYKFDKNGKFQYCFGEKGRGPGCVVGPGSLSILDNKYIIVNEYSTNRKISLFKLNGKIFKVINTQYPVYDSIALKGNKIAIVTHSYLPKFMKISIIIKDVISGRDNLIASKVDKIRVIHDSKSSFIAPDLQEEGFIRRTINGNLLVGFNYSNKINIYSPDGKKIKSFILKIEHTAVTRRVISEYKKSVIKKIKENFRNPVNQIKQVKSSNSFGNLFLEHLPIFSNILLDSHGNVLVFYYYLYSQVNFPRFQVYSPEGKYICESGFHFGDFEEPTCDFKFKNKMIFHNDHLYGLLDANDGDDLQRRIVKVSLYYK